MQCDHKLYDHLSIRPYVQVLSILRAANLH